MDVKKGQILYVSFNRKEMKPRFYGVYEVTSNSKRGIYTIKKEKDVIGVLKLIFNGFGVHHGMDGIYIAFDSEESMKKYIDSYSNTQQRKRAREQI